MSIMTTQITKDLENYLEEISINKKEYLNKIFESGNLFQKRDMQISWLESKLYQLLIMLNGSKNILEIGTFVGFSSAIAEDVLAKDAKITTCEIVEEHYNQALKNFKKFNLLEKINPILGDAKKIILSNEIQNQEFDLIFLDGDKENYPFYFFNLKDRLKKGGLFLVDNTLFKGDVINRKKSNYAQGINELNHIFKTSNEFFISHVTIGDGLLIAIKK